MSRRGFSDVTLLLNDLLDRHEANPAATRLLAYVDDAGFGSVRDRDRFEQALDMASQSGGIVIQRRKIDGSLDIAHIRLADAAALYQFLGRTPAHARVYDALAEARARMGLPATARQVLDELAAAWARGVGRFGLGPSDSRALRTSLDLALAIEARAQDAAAAAIDFRTFSRAAGVDSKALDRLAFSAVMLHTRLFPERNPVPGLDVEDLLSSYGITRTPQPLLLSGPLQIAGVALPKLAFYGVPPEQADAVGLAAPVDYVLIIENYISFIRHVREINADHAGLVIYSGGFPARTHLRQIVRLAGLAIGPVHHWGDLDAGGVRIFRHLEEALSQSGVRLRPHLMDPAMLRGQGVASNNQRRLVTGAAQDSMISELWDLIAQTSLALEQESVAPARPVVS